MKQGRFLNTLRFLLGLLFLIVGITSLESGPFDSFYSFVAIAFGAFVMAMAGAQGRPPDFTITVKKA